MKTQGRILIFGVTSGFLWSLVYATLTSVENGTFSGGFESPAATLTVLGAGVITGIVVSFLLYAPLRRWGRRGTLIAGALSLPLGAFLFGIAIAPLDSHHSLDAIRAGLALALLSITPVLGVVLLPLAMVTSWFLFRFAVGERPTSRGTE